MKVVVDALESREEPYILVHEEQILAMLLRPGSIEGGLSPARLRRITEPHSAENMIWLGRISCDCYYVNSMPRIGNEKSAVVQLVAVAPDGKENISDDASIRFSWI